MAGSKRHRANDDPPNDVKKQKIGDGSVKTGGQSVADQLAAIKARAAASRTKKDETQSTTAAAVIEKNAAPAPEKSTAQSKLAAIKAKLAAKKDAEKNKANDIPVKKEQDMVNEDAQEAKSGFMLHPKLMQKTGEAAESAEEMRKRANINPYFDEYATRAPPTKVSKRAERAFQFHEQGIHINQANQLRLKAEVEERQREVEELIRRKQDVDRTEKDYIIKGEPSKDWWDDNFILEEDYPEFEAEEEKAHESLDVADNEWIVQEVHHPILIEADELGRFFPKPMPLTKKEAAKKRRQKRRDIMQDHQAKVRLGLVEPDPPKVKLSNLMRVLGDEAVKDPTRVEARIRSEVKDRETQHYRINDERALTKEQRHEKDKANAAKDAEKGLWISAYRVTSMAFPKNRMKLDMNAKQCHDLTGIILTNPKSCLVLVESGEHTREFMRKLLTRRINWADNAPSINTGAADEDDEDDNEEDGADGEGKKKPKKRATFNEDRPVPEWLKPVDEDGDLKDLSENSCSFMWSGEIRNRAFRRWREVDCDTEGAAIDALQNSGFQTFWTNAKYWKD